MNTIYVSNRLDPDQARHFVGPDLDPNYLQRLSADGSRILLMIIWEKFEYHTQLSKFDFHYTKKLNVANEFLLI